MNWDDVVVSWRYSNRSESLYQTWRYKEKSQGRDLMRWMGGMSWEVVMSRTKAPAETKHEPGSTLYPSIEPQVARKTPLARYGAHSAKPVQSWVM